MERPRTRRPERNRLSLLSRWKIFDNLRRSTVEIAQLLLLIAAWTILPGSPLAWTAVALAAIAAPWIISLLLAVARPPLDRSWRAYYSAVARDARTSAQQILLTVAFLPHQAFVSLDAIVRTLWRSYVSKRHLLEWQTASTVERLLATATRSTARALAPGLAIAVLALAFVALAITFGGRSALALLAAAPVVLLWLNAPLLADRLSKAPVRASRELTTAQREQAMRYALLHWGYFDRFVSSDTNGLVPDNFQEDPAPVVALRTSPTNIGLQLLATVSAFDLGFVTADDMTARLERTFDTLESLDRHHGHFYNWYDVVSLRVLEPAYISTVDSGNLAGHLIALRQALLAIAQQNTLQALSARFESLSERAYTLAMAMDFGFLYDRSRKIFAIGYHPESHTRDSSFYDLLASEARLASFVAIAKNDVPVDHWFHLGRSLTHKHSATALVSWSGSMFEYLMPALVMRSWPLTLLDQTYRAAVRRQIAHGRARGVPWGESESAYAVRDRHFTYQYRAFGVADLALKRGLDSELVVAPYASALALSVEPARALANMTALEKKGALGPYGFRDALDYTRPAPGERFTIVRTYMAHHIGMSFVALANSLLSDVWPERFHMDPGVRATQLLLHERIPRRVNLHALNESGSLEVMPEQEAERPSVRDFETADTAQPHVALLGQLPYTIMVSHCGGGYSRFENLAVTRWRSDATTDNMGQFCFVKDVAQDRAWSVAHQPLCVAADWYRATFAADRVTFHRADGDIETRTEIAVVPEDSAEVRRVTVTNNSDVTRDVELTSYGEVVVAPPAAERAHPAFANLFVETQFHAWCGALTATRRPRSADEPSLVCVHVVATGDERIGDVTCETDRARFVGRGRNTRDPLALHVDGPLSGTTGAVLDPIFALRTRLRLAPGQSAAAAFTTLVAPTRARAFELADRYHELHAAQRALDLAWTTTQVELRELNLSAADASVFQELAGHLLYSGATLGPTAAERLAADGAQPLMWSIGLSGETPILLARIDSAAGLPTLRQIFSAHHYWRRRGLHIDLVVLNEQHATYLHELDDRIAATLAASTDAGIVDKPGGVFLRRRDTIPDDVARLLSGTARVQLRCDGRSLATILEEAVPAMAQQVDDVWAALTRGAERQEVRTSYAHRRTRRPDIDIIDGKVVAHQRLHDSPRPHSNGAAALNFDNGFGGLDKNDDYHIRVRGDFMPPAPWSNVIANPHGGFLVTERGAGYTWAANSYFYRLTPWHNDPVSDPPGDALYLQDEDAGTLWSPTPAPAGTEGSYAVRHGPGSSTFDHTFEGIGSSLTMAMADDAAVRVATLQLTNVGPTSRTLRLTAYVDWTLGVLREQTHQHIRTALYAEQSAVHATNPFDPQFATWVSFLALSEPLTAHTADRREFMGRNGTLSSPQALRDNTLSGATGVGLDPCAALQCRITLAPGEVRTVVVLLGAAADTAEVGPLIARYRSPERAAAGVRGAVDTWNDRLSTIAVKTPDAAFDAMINRWSLYQALACRMWARTGFYQSGGAYGFRDQLQDAMAFVYAEPAVAREHILRAAARQFVEGDVQHWWHPQSGRGVRTRFSDDLAWLPYVTEHYVRVTGDVSVLDEDVPFLTMRTLQPGEDELYDAPGVSTETATVYEHCERALRAACTEGAHGLPLIGTGDWNDGMNRVGVEGRGESVWLAWFLITTLRRFAPIAAARGADDTAALWLENAQRYADAVEAHGWDGDWYRRAYYDDGEPLGSAANDECRIDAIAQSWSVISGAGAPARQEQAMASLEEHLIDGNARIMRLLTPAFDKTDHDPGYIKGYLPGVRENGAQYTHAALWSVLATALQGRHERAFELFQMINPLTRTATPEDAQTYRVEPYVIAADVYSASTQLGRGGWTWYTGSASWLYRIGLETILGFVKEGNTLRILPRVPGDWPEYSISYRYGSATYLLSVRNGSPDAHRHTVVDGAVVADDVIRLEDDGEAHVVTIEHARSEAHV